VASLTILFGIGSNKAYLSVFQCRSLAIFLIANLCWDSEALLGSNSTFMCLPLEFLTANCTCVLPSSD